jgi:hypothetical protein
MNCNPAVEGKTVNSDTCYTADAVQKLVAGYNRRSTAKIRAVNPTDALRALMQQTKCKREDCLLKYVDTERDKMDHQHFAPDMPKEWLSNPDEWLSNIDIYDVIKQYHEVYPEFLAIQPTTIDFAKDAEGHCVSPELCRFSLREQRDKGKTKFGLVINLDVSTGSGTHWVSLYFDVENRYMIYFDSAGEAYIPKEISDFMDKVKTQAAEMGIKLAVYHNCKKVHQQSGSECGMYALFFIITQLTGKTPYGKKKMSIGERVRLFTKSRIPDDTVFKFRKLYFNVP